MSDSTKIGIDEIVIGDRARQVDRDWAEVLAASFKEGEMLNPITLWRKGDEAVLVAGLHRVEAHRINGETEIECHWSQAETLEDAEILETSENLLRNELTKLDRAQHLAVLKEAYEKKYPQAKKGGDKQTAKGREKLNGIIPFSSDAAAKVGLSESAVLKAVRMWGDLSKASRVKLRSTWLSNHQAGLMLLSEQSHSRQAEILKMIFPGQGKEPEVNNVPDAIFVLENKKLLTSVERRFVGLNKSLKSLADEEFNKLMSTNYERVAAWYRTVEGDQ